MKIKHLITIAILLTCKLVSGQKMGLITGTVQHINTREVLVGAVISYGDQQNRTITDSAGNFRLALPVGTYQISASNIGFITQIKYIVVVGSGNPQVVNFELQPELKNLAEVTISFKKGKSAIAADMVTPLSVQQLNL